MRESNDYVKRQGYILSSLGLFYLIIIGLFAIPLLGTFVVVLIKGVLELRYVIIVGGVAAGALAGVLLIRYLRRVTARARADGAAAAQTAEQWNRGSQGSRGGGPVQISVLNGLFTVSYGGSGGGGAYLPLRALEGPAPAGLLPEHPGTGAAGLDVVTQLKELSRLKSDGVISEAEFRRIKKGLIDAAAPSDGENGEDGQGGHGDVDTDGGRV